MQDSEIFGPEHQQIRETVRKFAKSLAPFAEEWDEAGIFPREVFTQAGDLGLLGIGHGEEHGGLGLDWWYTAAYAEELVHSNSAGVNMARPSCTTRRGLHTRPPSDATYTAFCTECKYTETNSPTRPRRRRFRSLDTKSSGVV